MPRVLMRLEGALVFAAATALFFLQAGGWVLYVALILAPDLAMLGYLAGSRTGSVTYNAVHTYVTPAALLAAAITTQHPVWGHAALVWAAHIGADRTLGLGLKYPTGFRDTHLQRV